MLQVLFVSFAVGFELEAEEKFQKKEKELTETETFLDDLMLELCTVKGEFTRLRTNLKLDSFRKRTA